MATVANVSREELLARAQADGDLETVARLLSARFSCRGYKPDAVPRAMIERALATAQLTGSWCNAQPWEVIVTEGEGTERFRAAMVAQVTGGGRGEPDFAMPTGYEGVFGERRREAGFGLYAALGIAKEDKAGAGRQMLENFRLFGAPHVLFLTTERAFGSYGVLDCGIYLGNLILALGSLGIASIAQGAFVPYGPFIREWFGIPEHRQLLVGLSFGFPDHDHPANGFRTLRGAPDAMVRWVDA